jgi:hypothetical protein
MLPNGTHFPAPRRARALALIGAALVACSPTRSRAPVPGPENALPLYEGTVVVDPAAGTLRGDWRISFVRNSPTADSAIFLLNDALTITRISGSQVLGYSTSPEPDLTRISVRLGAAPTRAATVIHVEYTGAPRFSSDGINGIGPHWVELGLDSFWLPIFADLTHAIRSRVQLVLPHGWDVVSSGRTVRSGDTLTVTSIVPLLDIAFAASPDFARAGGDSVTIHHVGSSSAVVARTLETARACVRYLDARYGAQQPLPPIELVLAPRDGPGYARRNYIVITRVADTSAVPLGRFVCHELAHNWSTGASASGPDNWLNESFAEFVSARFIRATSGDSAYAKIVAQWRERSTGQPPIWTSASKGRPSARTSYAKAPYLLSRLEERVGSAAMNEILRRFMTDAAIRTTPALIDVIYDVAGADTGAWFREELAKGP